MNTVEQLRKRKKRNRWLTLAVLVVLIGGGSGAAWYFLAGPGQTVLAATEEATPAYYTATVQKGDVRVSLDGSGTLTAYQSVDLKFSTSGIIKEVYVQPGNEVTKGETLAVMDGTETLEAAVASCKVDLLEAEQDLADLQKGADVSLAEAYQAYIEAQASQQDANFTNQRTAYARCSQEVNTRNALTLQNAKKKLDQLVSCCSASEEYTEAKNAYETALANYNYCMAYSSEEKTEVQAELDLADATLTSAEATYNTLKESSGLDPLELSLAEAKVTSANTQLVKAEQELAGATLTAPMDGVVTTVAAQAGSMMDTSTYITIADRKQAILEISVDEADVQQLAVGNTVEVVFDALPDRTFTGSVVQVDPTLNSSFGQYSVAQALVQLDDPAAEELASLPLGLSASVEVINAEHLGTLLIPLEALHDLGDGMYGVMVETNGQLRLRTVEVGLTTATQVEIISGLEAGEVISTGAQQVSSSR